MTGDKDARRIEASFQLSAGTLRQAPDDLQPEVAFVGRSNAGKSSTLNRLTGSKRLARVSKTPGRTQLINFFAVAGGGRLVDLPGYGYAKASKAKQVDWGRAIDAYLTHRANLAAVVLVMDARHPLQPFESQMLDWAEARRMPTLVLLNKADKLKQSARARALRDVAQVITRINMADEAFVTLFSAQTGLNSGAVIARVRTYLGHGR